MGTERVEPVHEPSSERQPAVRKAPPRPLGRARIQAKLKVGRADDPLEREADRVADAIMRSFGATEPPQRVGRIQRVESGADRLGGLPVAADVERSVVSQLGRGEPLQTHIASRVGDVVGHDLGPVRVHTDEPADRLARSLDARAFTVGRDVFVRSEDRPVVRSGLSPLLAHELAHVVQQGAVSRLAAPAGQATAEKAQKIQPMTTATVPSAGGSAQSNASPVPRLACEGATRIRRSTVEPDTIRRRVVLNGKPWGENPKTSQLMIQRDKESADLLTKLATPVARPGPEVEAQKEVVDAILKQTLPNSTILNLGGIALTRISDDDDVLVKQAIQDGLIGDLKPYGGYIGMKAWDEVEEAGIADKLIRNTLRTMIDAEQIKYLRKAGLPNEEFLILVEIHLYLERDMDQWGFHKDTKGQTLFVNLNYHMDQEVVGPEYVMNPPSTPEHDEALGIRENQATNSGTLPAGFLSDLIATRGALDEGAKIGNQPVPAYGYVAFVDEAIHHATPLYGHRSVKGGDFKTFLETTYPAEFKAAQKGYKGWKKSWTGAAWWGFSDYMDKSSPIKESDAAKWLEWMKMADDSKRDTKYQRPKFLASGMTATEVDQMLEMVGLLTRDVKDPRTGRPAADAAYFVDAGVPMPGYGSAIRSPLKKEGRPPLTRQMSQSALDRKLPPPAESKRRFFRTWVRAVRRNT